jgi:hypothetical protein
VSPASLGYLSTYKLPAVLLGEDMYVAVTVNGDITLKGRPDMPRQGGTS